MPNELKTAERLIETAPDSALQILQHLSPNKYKSGANRALYGLILIQALDKKLLPLKPDSLLDYSIRYFDQSHETDRLTTCYLYKGRSYKYAFQYEKAVGYYLKALDELKDSQNYLLLGRINSDLGDIYSIQSDFIKARQKYTLSFEDFKKAKNFIFQCYSLVDIGITFSHTKDYKTAQVYFHRVYSLAKDSMTQGAALDQIGRCYYNSNQTDSALIYLRKVLYYPFLGYNRAKRYNSIASLFLDQSKIDSSYYYAMNAFRYKPDIRTQRDCYRILTNSEYLRGNMHEMSHYMNNYVKLGDSIRKIDAQIKGSYLESMHNTKNDEVKSKNLVWDLSALVLLILACSYLFYRFLHSRTKKEKNQIQASHFEEKVHMRKKVIVDKRVVLRQKIKERKEEVLSGYKNISMAEREKQIRKIYNEFLHIDDSKFFFHEMNVVLNKLVTKIQERYTDINTKELIWCCLFMLEIPTHDMLIMLDYQSENSLKALKRRLPKKFNLDNATLLNDFLVGILSED